MQEEAGKGRAGVPSPRVAPEEGFGSAAAVLALFRGVRPAAQPHSARCSGLDGLAYVLVIFLVFAETILLDVSGSQRRVFYSVAWPKQGVGSRRPKWFGLKQT